MTAAHARKRMPLRAPDRRARTTTAPIGPLRDTRNSPTSRRTRRVDHVVVAHSAAKRTRPVTVLRWVRTPQISLVQGRPRPAATRDTTAWKVPRLIVIKRPLSGPKVRAASAMGQPDRKRNDHQDGHNGAGIEDWYDLRPTEGWWTPVAERGDSERPGHGSEGEGQDCHQLDRQTSAPGSGCCGNVLAKRPQVAHPGHGLHSDGYPEDPFVALGDLEPRTIVRIHL